MHMPIYLYTCPKHGDFERLRFDHSEEPEWCPKCGAEAPKKEFAPVAPFRWGPGGDWK